MRHLRWIAIALLSIELSCSGEDPDSRTAPASQLGPITTLRPNVAPAGATSNGLTKAFAATLPNASCTITGTNQTGQTITTYADDDGIVHLYYPTAPTAAQLPDLACIENGKEVTRHVQLQVAGTAPALLAGVKPSVHRVRPALPGNPLALSQTELLDGGYPIRPDPALAPQAYSRWSQLVSSPANEIAPKLVERPQRHSGTWSLSTSNIWSGYAISSPVTYEEVWGDWKLPNVSSSVPNGWASPWIGLDGFGTGGLIQDGVDLIVYQTIVLSPMPWIEYFPANSIYISNFPVSPGDELFSIVASTDANGNLSASGSDGWFYLYDVTNNYYLAPTLVKRPPNVTYRGATAEWIIEGLGSGTFDLTNYGTATVSDLIAIDSGNNERFFANDNQIDVFMENGNGGVLSAAAPNTSQTQLTFHWYSAH